MSQYRKIRENRARLEAAGWQAWLPQGIQGPPLWRNPKTGHWYTQDTALRILETQLQAEQ
jgi:hypothetical protein